MHLLSNLFVCAPVEPKPSPMWKGLLAYRWWNGALSTLHCAVVKKEQTEKEKCKREGAVDEREWEGEDRTRCREQVGFGCFLGGDGGFWSAMCRCCPDGAAGWAISKAVWAEPWPQAGQHHTHTDTDKQKRDKRQKTKKKTKENISSTKIKRHKRNARANNSGGDG